MNKRISTSAHNDVDRNGIEIKDDQYNHNIGEDTTLFRFKYIRPREVYSLKHNLLLIKCTRCDIQLWSYDK